jgi:hypothetical protein
MELEMDSSAAIAVMNRIGVGQLRHLEVKTLWVQQLVQEKKLTVKKIPGVTNTADIGTKILDVTSIKKYSLALNLIEKPDGSGGSPPSHQVCQVRVGGKLEAAVQATILALMPYLSAGTDSDYYDKADFAEECNSSCYKFAITFAIGIFIFIIVWLGTFKTAKAKGQGEEDKEQQDFELVDLDDHDDTEYKPTRLVARCVTNKISVTVRTVAVQAPVTYKRKWATPRFQPLPETQHGVFGEFIG